MPDNPQSSDGVITRRSSRSVGETVDRLTRVIAERGFTLFRVSTRNGYRRKPLGQNHKVVVGTKGIAEAS